MFLDYNIFNMTSTTTTTTNTINTDDYEESQFEQGSTIEHAHIALGDRYYAGINFYQNQPTLNIRQATYCQSLFEFIYIYIFLLFKNI